MFKIDKEITELLSFLYDNPTIARPIMKNLKLTRKQFYSRMFLLKRNGLISKTRGVYFLTSYGIVMMKAIKIMEHAESNKWKLEAIDSAPAIHQNKLSDVLLIDDPILKEMLG